MPERASSIASGSFTAVYSFVVYWCLINFLENFFQSIDYHQQAAWIHTRTAVLSGLVRVKTVCEGYRQTALAGKE